MRRFLSMILCAALLMTNLVLNIPKNAQALETPSGSNSSDHVETGRNLEQTDIAAISKMPQLPSQAKVIDWNSRGNALDKFLFDWNWQATPGRKFGTIFQDSKFGGFLMPSYYGETRSLNNLDGQESITVMGALLGGSLLGNKKDVQNPEGQTGETYLDSTKKYFWTNGGVFTNFANQATGTSAYNDLWYLLLANENFYRLSSLYPNWNVNTYLSSVADKLCAMVDVLGGQNCDFNIQAFNFNTMQPQTGGWSQPDAAAGTANILYYAYQIFGNSKYLTYAKYCMNYLDKLDNNPYYENMLIEASYVAARMNAEVGTNYNIAKYLNWITGTDSSVRNWGGIDYTQDGRDVYGLTGEARGGRQYAFFLNSVYPMTSILPTAKYDPSYAKAAGKWALNIVSSARYFLPSEWPAENQSDPEFKGKPEENVLAYEGFKKYSEPGQDGPNVTTNVNFMGTGDAMMNATTGWQAGKDVTNLGIYGSIYTEFLGALVEKTNVDNILKLDCNKTDYFQKSMYPTYLYYNPYNEPKMVDITLSGPSDLYDSVTGTYLAKNVTGKQSFKILADSARVIVVTSPGSSSEVTGDTTTINGKLVAHSTAETLPEPTGIEVSSVQIQSASGNQITKKSQQLQLTAQITPADAEDTRVIWSVTNLDGSKTDKAAIDSNGLLTAQKNGDVKVTAISMDGSNVSDEKSISITGQTLPSLSYGKNTTVSSQNGDFGGNLAVDGNLLTRWIADSNEANPWIYVDLGATATIDSIVLNWEAARPPKYRVEVSGDAKSWTTVREISDSGNSPAIVTIQPSTSVTARYVRVYTEQKSDWGASMYEFDVNGTFQIDKPVTSVNVTSASSNNTITTKNRKLQMNAAATPTDASDSRVEWYVYNKDGSETDIAEISSTGLLTPFKNGTVRVTAKSVDGSNVTGSALVTISGQDMVNLSLGGTASASQSESQNQPAGAIDGNYTTRWASGSTIGDASLTIDLKQAYPVSKVVLNWEAAYALQYKIQGSSDGTTFTDLYVQSNGKGGMEEISLNSPQKVRYLRMQGVQNKPGLGFSLYEMEAYTTDKSALQSLVNQNASLTKGCYTDASWSQFSSALQTAQNYLKDEMSSQKQLDSAANDLSAAVTALREKTPAEVADGITGLSNPKKGYLQLELPRVDGYEITIYSSNNPAVVSLNGAISPLPNDTTVGIVLNISRDGINAQTKTFSVMIPGVLSSVDKGDLASAVASAQEIDKNLYTETSYQVLSEAIQSAQAVLQNADATQAQVDSAKTALDTALKGLVVKEEPTQPQTIELKNEETGITVTAAANVLPEGATLYVDVLSQGSGFQLAQNALSDVGSKLKVLDIHLQQGEKIIQPNGTITVRMSIPTGFDKTRLALFNIAADGKRTQLPIRIDGNEIVFQTTHFSTYALVETSASYNSQNGNGHQTGGQSPQTGDTPLTMYFIVGTAVAFAVIILLKRRKTVRE